jgi:hypothetical protein
MFRRHDGIRGVLFAGTGAERLGRAVHLDFRFLESPAIAQVLEDAGFRIQMRLERVSYPGEVDTRRAYLLAQRQN